MQTEIPFARPAEAPAEVELINVHPAWLLPPGPGDDVRDRTTAEYREWFERLVADVRASGVRQPILAFREGDRFRVIDGETRRLACLVAALASVSVLVLRQKPQGAALKVAMLQANAMRCDMSDLDYARVYVELMRQNDGWTQARLARELNHPAAVVSKRLKVIQHLPADLLLKLGEAEGQIPFSTAYCLSRAFEKLGDVPARPEKPEQLTPRSLAERVMKGLLVRDDAEEAVNRLLGKGKASRESKPMNLSVAGAKVTLKEATLDAFKALAARLTEAARAFEKGGYATETFRAVLPSLLKS